MSIVMPNVLYRYMAGLATHDVDLVATTVSDSLVFVAATRTLSKPEFLAMLLVYTRVFRIGTTSPSHRVKTET